MHTWETMMSAASNFELQNWHANLASIKPEPIDSPQHSEPDSFDHKTLLFDSLNPSSYGGSHPLGFNPLTPPGYPNVLLPQHQHHSLHRPSTPCSTRTEVFAPPPNLTPTNTPPMDVTPPKSPPKDGQETPEKDVTSEYGDSYDGMSEDDGDIRTPKVNSHGKIKTYKCKQCGFVAVTKVSFWDHTKSHMKPEKILTCQKCPFVTEYKHHLEYHLRNHQRSKPFQCSQCSYSCVNKSMLNSHLKSHSSVFQYRCADCSYATKYCHSLKLHLRKYTHKPDVVLNLDGTPNPLPIIDVYGTRRGPKAKPKQRDSPPPPPPPALAPKETSPEPGPNIPDLAKIFQNTPPNMPLFPYLNLNLHMFAAQRMAQLDSQAPHPPEEALNLVQKEQAEPRTPKHRRKGRAFKLDRSMDVEDEDTSGADNEAHAIGSSNDAKEATSSSSNSINNSNNNSPEVVISARKQFECKFCDISFKDDVLYTIHMGYHGYNDVFKCNMCGEKCDDRVSFFLHIARSSHT